MKIACLLAAGWLGREFVHRGRMLGHLRAFADRQRLLLQQGGVLNAALREELAARGAAPQDQGLDVPIGVQLPDAVTIGLGQFEQYTDADWEAWREATYTTIRGLVARRVEVRAGQEVARLEAMARGVGPDAAPPERGA